ncbi:hypothetical protein ASE06_10960 [Sphingopyxis sp. Root214]|uniref:hypothetical protein n=1 Tax=Alphaproteobacteria TaxID=28211 RepID=UPI0006F40CE0|nr:MULTISPECIES: hypothetical protein [unclassified Sphingopyxis]KQZ72968.1 hypothetical protein ASD73_08610 [Sphingopyxis sp. Root154]KRC07114.1 hypothetical protein ASE06_10960 [Sphingopyxis sp. Root214]
MHCFRVDAILDPQSLPRVANYFAQRSIVPSAMAMQVLPTHMRIEVTVAGLAHGQAAIIAAKLGEVVAVLRSELEDPTAELVAAA